jgi:hypothetical protein
MDAGHDIDNVAWSGLRLSYTGAVGVPWAGADAGALGLAGRGPFHVHWLLPSTHAKNSLALVVQSERLLTWMKLQRGPK